MNPETVFRLIAFAIFFVGVGISISFRHKANRKTGESISRNVDGNVLMNIIRLGGLAPWLSPILYLLNPAWMTWSKIGLPEGLRWLGVGLGILCNFGIYWLFSSLGNNITPTSVTRREHKLVTSGPYHWVQHPLYTIGSTLFVSFGLVADNWFIAALGLLAFIVMAIRAPTEKANLIEKFGNEYREYMKNTGAFLPKLF